MCISVWYFFPQDTKRLVVKSLCVVFLQNGNWNTVVARHSKTPFFKTIHPGSYVKVTKHDRYDNSDSSDGSDIVDDSDEWDDSDDSDDSDDAD